MEINVHIAVADELKVDCLVVGVAKGRRLNRRFVGLGATASAALTALIEPLGFKGEAGESLWLHACNVGAARSLLLVGVGTSATLKPDDWDKVLHAVSTALSSAPATRSIAWGLTAVTVRGCSAQRALAQAIEAIGCLAYRFEPLKSAATRSKQAPFEALLIAVSARGKAAATSAVTEARALLKGLTLGRDLANLPANVCTPTYLAEQAQRLANEYPRITTTVIDAAAAEALGMKAFLAVAAGSCEPPQFITLSYAGGKAGAPSIVLIGKGVTFDAGGISLKPSAKMDEMKFDMCGAASVLGALVAAAELDLKLNIAVLVPATENLPDGKAIKPGDIVRTMSGQTVEILNTDAEGRLILCDAIHYAKQHFDCDAVIDVATLTGACIVALGAHASGVFSNHRGLAKALCEAGEIAADRAWEMPLWDAYGDALKSQFADLANISSDGAAGAIVGAAFLAKFATSLRWAHIDIAGTAWRGGSKKGATGRPIGLLLQYLLQRAERSAKT